MAASNLAPETDMDALSVQETVRSGVQQLQPHRTAHLDAELLLAHVLQQSRVWVLTHTEQSLTRDQYAAFQALVARRWLGEPLAYIRGYVEWFGSRYIVTPDVLIPRPETELMLSAAITLAHDTSAKNVVDVGTGSGALATQLALNLPVADVIGVDVSPAALAIAQRNAAALGVDNQISFFTGDLLAPLSCQPDLIVANLPYLSDSMMRELPRDVRFEPTLALYGGREGTDLYERLFAQVESLAPRAALVLEIAPEQVDRMVALVNRCLACHRIDIYHDYAGCGRYIVARFAGVSEQ